MKGEQVVDSNTSGELTSRDGRPVVCQCTTRVGDKEQWRSIADNHHSGDGT